MLYGDTIRDYLCVHYAARIILDIINNSKAKGIYNVGSGTGISVSSIIHGFANYYNKDIDLIEFGENMSEDPNQLIVNMNKTIQVINTSLWNEIKNSDQIKTYLLR